MLARSLISCFGNLYLIIFWFHAHLSPWWSILVGGDRLYKWFNHCPSRATTSIRINKLTSFILYLQSKREITIVFHCKITSRVHYKSKNPTRSSSWIWNWENDSIEFSGKKDWNQVHVYEPCHIKSRLHLGLNFFFFIWADWAGAVRSSELIMFQYINFTILSSTN